MASIKPNIVIVGAGIAGLWLLSTLKSKGFDVLLLEKDAIGGKQTMASQGIIHSGLKYTLGKEAKAASETIRAMPDEWQKTDFLPYTTSSENQQLLIPKGFIGNIVKSVSQRAMQGETETIEPSSELLDAGFAGSVVNMNEPVLNVPQVVRALAEPHMNCIRKCRGNISDFLIQHQIEPQKMIFTAAEGNAENNQFLKTQKRPLLMGLLKPAPFPLYAHLVGTSDKPIATITSHLVDDGEDGSLCWYIGGQVAERAKEADPSEVYHAIKKAFAKYLPNIDISHMEFGTVPVDRVEGLERAGTNAGLFMPDMPCVQEIDETLYCWPTKLTFAPMLGDMILEHIKGIGPSIGGSDYSGLEPVDFARAPWDIVTWTKEHSDKAA